MTQNHHNEALLLVALFLTSFTMLTSLSHSEREEIQILPTLITYLTNAGPCSFLTM